MSVTPNFSWPLIQPTDFVTDLPADLELLADDIDADVWAIKGTADAALPETIIDAAGDLIYGTAADTAARLAIGTAGQILTVNSGATAPQWSNPASAGANWTLLNSGGTTLNGAATVTVSGISGADKIMVVLDGASNTGGAFLRVRFNADSGNNYYNSGGAVEGSGTFSAGSVYGFGGPTSLSDGAQIGVTSATSAAVVHATQIWSGCNSSGIKTHFTTFGQSAGGGSSSSFRVTGGIWNNSATVTSVSVTSTNTNFDAGTIWVYTSA